MFEQKTETEPDSKRLRFDSKSNTTPTSTAGTSKCSFAPPKTKEEMCKAKLGAIPASTASDTKYCVGVWNDWCRHRLAHYGDAILPLDEITITDLAEYLSSFIYEVRKQDGSEFPPESLHHIVSGLQRFLCWNG